MNAPYALAATHQDYPTRRYAWSVVAILIATAILSYTDRQVLTLLVDPIRRDLGVSDAGIGLLIGSAFAIVYGIAGIPLGFLADRVSRRNLILGGILLWSLATISCGFARDFRELFTARIFVGLGEAVLSPAAISLISDYFPPERRGTAVGLFLSGIAMGVGTAILIGGAVLHAVDAGVFAGSGLASLTAWRLVLVLLGLPGLAWSVVILLIREPTRRPDTATTDGTSAERARDTPFSWTRVVSVYLVVGMASLVDNAVGAWAPSLLIRSFGKDAADVGVQLGVLLTAGYGGGVLLGGMFADRAGLAGGWRRKLRLALIASCLILPTCSGLLAQRYDLVLWAIPCYFMLSGAVTAIGFSSMLDLVSSRSRALAISISFFINVAIGGAAGPAAVPFANAHLFGATAKLGPPIALTVATGYVVIVLALLLAMTRSKAHSG
jgi:MFS family permease